jgi:hypothetical protein
MVTLKVLEGTGHVVYEMLVEKFENNKQLNRPENRRDIEMNVKALLLRIIVSDVSLLTSL